MTNPLALGSNLHDWVLRRQEGVHGPLDLQRPPTGDAIRERTAAALVATPLGPHGPLDERTIDGDAIIDDSLSVLRKDAEPSS
jgi:hypothetical protein